MAENSASVIPKPPTHYHVFPQNSTRLLPCSCSLGREADQ